MVAMGYLTDSPAIDGLIEIEKLTFVLLHDEPIRGGACAVRLSGFRGCRVPWGTRLGSRNNCRFIKDLMLQPVRGGQGYRLDLNDEELLGLGLQLDHELDQHARFHKSVRDRPMLPKLWAGFEPDVAAGVNVEGPELQAYASQTGKTPQALMERLRREHQGLTVFPLAWVSHLWRAIAAVYADLRHYPKRQLFRLERSDNLVGFQGAAEFDFTCRAVAVRRRRRRRSLAKSPPDRESSSSSSRFPFLIIKEYVMARILVINNNGAGFADYTNVAEGTTVNKLFAQQVPQGRPEDYLIRVNRQPVASDQVLQEGDRISITPTKIEGALR
jgi:hypothetical protein